MWVIILINYFVIVKGNVENVIFGFFIFCFRNFKIVLKVWSFQVVYFIKEINLMVQRGLGFLLFVVMMDILGFDLSIRGSFV